VVASVDTHAHVAQFIRGGEVGALTMAFVAGATSSRS